MYTEINHQIMRIYVDKSIDSSLGFTLPLYWRKQLRTGIKVVIFDASGLDGISACGLAWFTEARKAMEALRMEVYLAYIPEQAICRGGGKKVSIITFGNHPRTIASK